MDVSLTFDPIPDEVWNDWKWFVYPEGCLLGMREGKHRVGNADIVLTPCYIVNLPKLVMSDIMWASRLDTTSEGVVDTQDHLRPVCISVDSVLESIIYLLSQYPMVIRRRGSEGDLQKDISDMIQEDELVLLNQGSEASKRLGLEDLEVQFYNPYSEGAKPCVDILGMVIAEACINELSIAKAGIPDSVVRETICNTIGELEKRELVKVKDGVVTGMTEKGKAVLDVEPVHDMLSCRCEVEPSGQ